MFSSLLRLVTTGALLLVVAPAFAQSVPNPAAYAGPRYPGGPDSLRALVGRSTRQAVPGLTGRILVQFELQSDGRPHSFTTIRPPKQNKELVKASAMALQYLEAHMLSWQPSPTDDKTPAAQESKISLLLDFVTPPASQPYCYAEQSPVFNPVVLHLLAQYAKSKGRAISEAEMQENFTFGTSAKGMAVYTQMQVKYPAQAIHSRESGTVYAYFEVAENGSVEQAAILGSAGSSLNAEVMRVLKTLPTATTPAMLNGQPVRMYYVTPVTFKMSLPPLKMK